MPRVLFFAPAFAPNFFSEGLVNSKLALAMQFEGWDVHVVAVEAGGATYSSTWNERWQSLKNIRYDADSSYEGGKVITLCKNLNRLRYPIQGMNWAANALDKALELHRDQPFDLVLSRSTSCMAHLPALAFKKITGCRWAANWNDPAPYLFPAPYSYKMIWWKRWIFAKYMRKCARSADYNSFPSERLQKYLSPYLGVRGNKNNRVIPHIAMPDYEVVSYHRSGEFRLCHAGNLSPERNPRLFLLALKRLRSKHPDTPIHFDIIGLDNAELKEIIDDLEMGGAVSFISQLGFKETMDNLCVYDVNVVIEACCSNGIFMPSKLTDYAQVGRPVLSVSPEQGVLRDWLLKYGGGLAASNTDEEDIYQKLEQLYEAWQNDTLDRFLPYGIAFKTSCQQVLLSYDAMLSAAVAPS